MKIEQIAIEKLIPYIGNSRTHSGQQIEQIIASIKEFGFTNPVLIDNGDGIIAGHGRVMAAQKLGIKEVPCIRLSHLTEIQRKAYVIADNSIALNAGWDIEMLEKEVNKLKDEDFNIAILGLDCDFDKDIETEIKEINTTKPPSLGWILISIPIQDFGKLQTLMDGLPENAETYSTYTDNAKED